MITIVNQQESDNKVPEWPTWVAFNRLEKQTKWMAFSTKYEGNFYQIVLHGTDHLMASRLWRLEKESDCRTSPVYRKQTNELFIDYSAQTISSAFFNAMRWMGNMDLAQREALKIRVRKVL